MPALLALTLFTASAWYLTRRFEWQPAFDHLLRTDFVRLVVLVSLVHFAYICVRTWRWRIMVRHVNPEVGLMDLYWITAVVVSLAILTPGQLGEALKIELLSRRGLVGRLPGLGAFALERIMDLLALSGMGLAGLLFGSGLAERYPGLEKGVGLLLLAGLLALYLLLHFRPGGRAAHWLEKIRAGSGSPAIRIKIALLTLLAWLLIGAGWQISLQAVDIHLALPEIIWLIALVTLGSLLSFIPGGLGVAEVLTVEALVDIGVSPLTAQAGALILRAYALILILFGLVHLLLWLSCWIPIRSRCRDSTN